MPAEENHPATTDKPISASGLTMVYKTDILKRRSKALDELDLEIEPGEIYGYLGSNGAGKTTTIKLLVGLLRPTAGSARVLGQPIGTIASRREVGFLPENPYFYEYLSAVEALDFYGSLSGMSRADRARRIPEILELVNLKDAAKGRIGSYSKGMRQRLGLAQALVHEPKLLILDEPMSGLDPIGRREVREIILLQRDLGRTIFFSSHILADVELICDRIGIISKGKLIESGHLAELMTRETRSIEVTVRGVTDEQLSGAAPPDALTIASDAGLTYTVPDQDAADRLVDATRAAGGQVTGLTPSSESLEEYFMRTQSTPSRDNAGGNGE